MGFGDYPAEYDRAKHGPYDPARYYGKPDTPFGDVKLGELTAWLRRRNFHPVAMTSAVSRAYWRWQHKYVFPERAGIASFFQMAVGLSALFYVLNYQRIKHHKNYNVAVKAVAAAPVAHVATPVAHVAHAAPLAYAAPVAKLAAAPIAHAAPLAYAAAPAYAKISAAPAISYAAAPALSYAAQK